MQTIFERIRCWKMAGGRVLAPRGKIRSICMFLDHGDRKSDFLTRYNGLFSMYRVLVTTSTVTFFLVGIFVKSQLDMLTRLECN